jgi:hypothetical protein
MHGLVQLAARKWLEIREAESWGFQSAITRTWGLGKMLFPNVKLAERQQPIKGKSVRDWAQILRRAGALLPVNFFAGSRDHF